MDEGHDEAARARDRLRQRLADWQAAAGLDQTQLARRARLGRTTVSEALRKQGPVPSARTLAALAGALRKPPEELLELRRRANGEGRAAARTVGPDRPIGQWEPHDLEVHPAGTLADGVESAGRLRLSGYVQRQHDRDLADVVKRAQDGRSQLVVLTGTSSTGKTRACWEAIQPLAELGWSLWHPFDPTRAEAALEHIEKVQPRTVVWINEAQHYLGDALVGEQIASALHTLLTEKERAPVLVLGTLWPEYLREYTAVPSPGAGRDRHSRVRELLAGRTINVPESFDEGALRLAAGLARKGDDLLADVLTRSSADGRVTQELAGAPELLRRYKNGSPAARALLNAAMDARRLGGDLHLPKSFLVSAAADYIADADWCDLPDGWAELAFGELAKRVHGKLAPMRRVAVRPVVSDTVGTSERDPEENYRLADYLEQHGRDTRRSICPPVSFWRAAYRNFESADALNGLANSAYARHRLQWAYHMKRRAEAIGHPDAYRELAQWLDTCGYREEAGELLRHSADSGRLGAYTDMAFRSENDGDLDAVEEIASEAEKAGNPRLLSLYAYWWEGDGNRERAESVARRLARAGYADYMVRLAVWRDEAGDREEAESLARQAADAGQAEGLALLAIWRYQAGEREEAEGLLGRAVDTDDGRALARLAVWKDSIGERDSADILAARAAAKGEPGVFEDLAFRCEERGDFDEAEAVALKAARLRDYWNPLRQLAISREQRGEFQRAEFAAQLAAEGDPNVLTSLALLSMLGGGGRDRRSYESLLERADGAGDIHATTALVMLRCQQGDYKSAETLAWRAAERKDTTGLDSLIFSYVQTGREETARKVAWRAFELGHTGLLDGLVSRLMHSRNKAGAVGVAWTAAERQVYGPLRSLVKLLDESEDRAAVERMVRCLADAGELGDVDVATRWWPDGIEPDGTPAGQWRAHFFNGDHSD